MHQQHAMPRTWPLMLMLSIPYQSLQLHRLSQKVCVIVVDRVRLCVFNVSVRVIKPSFVEKQLRQGGINQNQCIEFVEKGYGSKGHPAMVNRPPDPVLESTYSANNSSTNPDQRSPTFLREDIDRAGYGFFCGVKLVVAKERQRQRERYTKGSAGSAVPLASSDPGFPGSTRTNNGLK